MLRRQPLDHLAACVVDFVLYYQEAIRRIGSKCIHYAPPFNGSRSSLHPDYHPAGPRRSSWIGGFFVDCVPTPPFRKCLKLPSLRGRSVRDGMLNLPDRLAAVLAAEHDATRVHTLLTTEIRTVLVELSDADSG